MLLTSGWIRSVLAVERHDERVARPGSSGRSICETTIVFVAFRVVGGGVTTSTLPIDADGPGVDRRLARDGDRHGGDVARAPRRGRPAAVLTAW